MMEVAHTVTPWVVTVRKLAGFCLWFWVGARSRQHVAAEYTVATATHPEPSCLWLSMTSTVVHF